MFVVSKCLLMRLHNFSPKASSKNIRIVHLDKNGCTHPIKKYVKTRDVNPGVGTCMLQSSPLFSQSTYHPFEDMKQQPTLHYRGLYL